MPREKIKQKLMKHRLCATARIIACVSFLVLTVIGVSSLVRAMSLESVENQNGIPSSWQIASLGNPETITMPITYWDQRMDDCKDPNRQFEWSECRLYAKGIISNVVKSQLGADGLPVPTYTNNKDAWAAYHDAFTANVVGNDPVQPTDNFYRWFHETYDANGKQLSKQYDRTVTFHRTNNNTYEYGSKGTFPLDDVDFSKDDYTNAEHNFHFTAHMQIPMKIVADGSEQFWFSGDDDVWVFLNGQLVLDLGGLHMDTEGSFTINANGDVVATVNNVADQKCRQEKVFNPLHIGYDTYNSQVENSCPRSTKTTVIKTGFNNGDVVNLDFFYAERSTTESNTRITISNMQWPISADSEVTGEIKGKVGNSESNLVEYITSVQNRDPKFPLELHRISSYVYDESSATDKAGETQSFTNTGFIPLSNATLYYSTSLENPNWQPVEISAPMNSMDGFKLNTPLTMARAGHEGDTLYFRFAAETSEYTGNIANRTSFYTELDGISGVTYDHVTIPYTGKTTTDTGEEPTKQYNLSIEYRIDFGDEEPDLSIQTPPAINETHDDGYEFAIVSPEVPGFTPDIDVVEGKITGSDIKRIVTYTKENVTPAPKYTVTIRYQYENGDQAASDYYGEYSAGEEFSIPSPVISGYNRDIAIVAGKITDHDREFTVTYTAINKPTEPVGPTNPVNPDPTPEEPDDNLIPSIPVNPDDDELTYTGPLGESVFVPNTGIVSDVVAPIFEQYFADLILSQGFVLTILLIFAGSFSTYFSLRKYLHLTVAPATTRTIKRMPKTVANSKISKTTKNSRIKSSKKSK